MSRVIDLAALPTDSGIVFPEGTSLNIDSNTLYIDSANNRIGIGTASPSSELHVVDASGSSIIRASGDSSGTTVTTQLVGSVSGYGIVGTTTNHDLAFFNNNTERMRITSGGAVGIGTTSPAYKVHINSGSSQATLRLQSDTAVDGFVSFLRGATDVAQLRSTFYGCDLNGYQAVTFSVASTEYMRVTNAGNVGIGTISPATKLHVAGDAIIKQEAGNTAVFSVAGNNNSTGLSAFEFIQGGDNHSYIVNRSNADIRIYTNNTEHMRITSTGNVGIGTTSPDHVVHVSSATSGNLLRLSSDVSGFNSTLTVDGATANTIKLHAGYFDTLELGADDTSYLRIYTNGNLGYTGANIALDSNVANNQYITLTGPTTVVIAEAGYLAGTYYIRCTGANSEQEIIINAHRKLYNNGQINILLDKSQTGTQALSNFRIAEDRTLGKCYLLADGVLPNNTNVSITCLGIGTYPVVALAAKSVTEQYPTKPMLHTNGNMYGVGVYASTSQQGVTLNAAGQFIGANYAVFACNGDTTQINNRTNSTGTIIDLRYNGAIRGTISTNGTNIAYNTSSDYRLKENNVNITDGISKVKLLKPYRFNFIDSPDKIVDGFFAHEVQSIVPEAVTGEKDAMETIGNIVNEDGDIVQTETTYKDNLPEGQTWVETETRPVYQGIDQAKLVPLLTAALQEAITKIETLETRIQTLENN